MSRMGGSARLRRGAVRALLLGMALGVVLGGCGYRPLGTNGTPASSRQVSVGAIANETMRPGVQGVVAAALLRQLRLHGILRTPDAGTPDLMLSGGVTAYLNEPIGFDRQDIGRRFRVRVTLLSTLVGRTDGRVRFNEAITGEAYYTAGVGAVSARNAEDEALQFAAQDLASKVVARLLEEW